MYSTCLFCHGSLGRNESIEHCPIGKRLAFDAKAGRLWVVCSKCARWNLSPIEERWEAIEESERAYRGTKLRAATDNIGLARLRDGTELVRIGAPLRPEFAAWRYGDQFGRRFRRKVIAGIGGAAAYSALTTTGAVGVLGWFGGLAIISPIVWNEWRERRKRTMLKDDDGVLHAVSLLQIRSAAITTHWMESRIHISIYGRGGNAFALKEAFEQINRDPRDINTAYIRNPQETISLTGTNAMRAMSHILPTINSIAGSRGEVSRALSLIEDRPSAATLILNARRLADGQANPHLFDDGKTIFAARLPAPTRLALEMTLHEDDERRALEGELHVLEQRWKDAEEIASIADSLTLPDSIHNRITRKQDR